MRLSPTYPNWTWQVLPETLPQRITTAWGSLRTLSTTEWLLSTACVLAGLLTFVEGPVPGCLGLIAGITAAAEVVLHRATLSSAFLIIIALGVSQMSMQTQRGLILGLLDIVAITTPLHRSHFQALVLSQILLLMYGLGYFTLSSVNGIPISWGQLVVNVIVFNVIAGVANDMASRRRVLEANLTRETNQALTLARALKREEILRHSLMTIRADRNSDAVLHRLVASAQQLLDTDFARILPATEIAVQARRSAGAGPDGGQADRTIAFTPRPLPQLVVERRQPLWLHEWRQERLAGVIPGVPFGEGTLALVPVMVSGNVCAVLVLAWPLGCEVAVPDRAAVTVLAEQAGVALERIMAQEELAARAMGAEALHRASAQLAGHRDLRSIAEEALTALRDLYRADAAVFYRYGPGNAAEAMVAQGLSPDTFANLHGEYAGGRRDWLLRSGRSVVVSKVSDDRRLRTRELLASEGIESLIDVPTVWEDQTVGGLVLYHQEPRAYSPYEIQLLETFAQQLAGGMELANAYQAIESFDHQREEFLALMSHELRQPVAGIGVMAEALAGAPGLGPEETRALEAIRQQAQSLAGMAEDVLAIAQLENGHFTLRPTSFDLTMLVAGLRDQSTEPARIAVSIPELPVFLDGDPERLVQALANIVSNALKYSDPETTVSVRLSATESVTTIAIEDHGVGLEPHQIQNLFQKYSRLPNRRSALVKGAGLGLYLTRLIIEAHGGTIAVTSPGPNQGSTFTVSLPRHGVAVISPHGGDTMGERYLTDAA